MRTSDVKVGQQYLYKDAVVTIVKRLKGVIKKNSPNYQSGILFTGMQRTRKSFELSNGEIVYANELSKTN